MKEFHVLVVDDSREVIARLRDRISPQHSIAGTTWRVVFRGVYVDIIHEGDAVRFSDDTFQSLIAACAQRPHLILADFGFPSRQQSEQLRSGAPLPDQFIEQVLCLPDLVPAVEQFLEREHPADKQLTDQVRTSFRDNPCRLYLYTYTTPKYKNALPTVDARSKRTQQIFQRANVIPVDTTIQFYDSERYADKHDKDFYAYLLTGFLDQLIQRELFAFVLDRETERLRFVRYYRSGVGVIVIVLLGGAIGAVGEWLGARLIALVIAGFSSMAITLGILAGVVLFILGLFVPLVFERLMSNLLRKLKSDELDPNA